MDQLNFNNILGREQIAHSIKNVLTHFNQHKTDLSFKRGIYIYGAPGSGKTEFVIHILKQMNYDIVKYDAGDIRNKSIIDAITKHNMADKSVISLLHKKAKPIAIVMDEIDGLNGSSEFNSIQEIIDIITKDKDNKKQINLCPVICTCNSIKHKKLNLLKNSILFVPLQNSSSFDFG